MFVIHQGVHHRNIDAIILYSHIIAHAFALKVIHNTGGSHKDKQLWTASQNSSCPLFLNVLQLASGNTRPGYDVSCTSTLYSYILTHNYVKYLHAGVHLQLLDGTRVSNHGFLHRGELNPLLCVTPDNTTCCSAAETGGAPLGNWYFPNGTEVPPDSTGWLFYSTRGPGLVRLHRRTGGVSGIYRCEIPDLSGVNQTIYVGLYTITRVTSGE